MVGAWKLVLLLIAAITVGQLTGWTIADQLAIAIIVLLAGGWLWSRLSLEGVSLVREITSDRAQVGQFFHERFRVRNAGRLGKLWIEVTDHSTLPRHLAGRVLHLGGRSTTTWDVATLSVRRGRYRVGPVTLRAGDPLGLFPRRVVIAESHEVVVYPAVVDLEHVALPDGALAGGSALQRRSPVTTPNVAGIRDYTAADGFNRISWSATARLGRLMVKEFDVDPTADAWIVLDLDRSVHLRAPRAEERGRGAANANTTGSQPWLDSTEDYAVTIAASLARYLLAGGRRVGLVADGATIEVLLPDRSDRQLLKMFETLAVASADGEQSLAEVLTAEGRRFARHDTLLVVTPATSEKWIDALSEIAGRRVRTSVMLIEPATFATAPSSIFAIGRLAAAGIPTHMIKYGDDLSTSLAGQTGAGSARSVRRNG